MIENQSRGTQLATEVTWALSAADRMRGLLDRQALATGEALILSPCNSVHTFFMRFPIDVVFVSADGTVVRAIEELPPWRMTWVYFKARHTIELPVGSIAASLTREGDQLALPLHAR
ncbi:MAG: hypothetical protein CMP23_07410 [Rickettsiales bacterium]|nr:hypothetical protein [Rickettsiales bacterium]